MSITRIACLVVQLLLLNATAMAAPVGGTITYQGELQDGGLPAVGDYEFEFRLFDMATGGAQQGPAENDVLTLNNGVFTTALNFGEAPFLSGERLWLEVAVRPLGGGGFTTLDPRQEITGTSYALHALSLRDDAVSADQIQDGSIGALDVNENQVQWRIANSCPPGQSIRSIDAFGNVNCEFDDDQDTTYDGTDFAFSDQNCVGDGFVKQISDTGFIICGFPGDINSVTAGDGLSGGADMGDVVIDVDYGAVQARVDAACASGSAIGSIAEDGSISCETVQTSTDPFGGKLHLPGSAFVQDRAPHGVFVPEFQRDPRGFSYLSFTQSAPIQETLQVPVHLPVGAQIDLIEIFYYDNESPANVQLQLMLQKRLPTQTDADTLATITTSTTSGASTFMRRESTTAITQPVVSAQNLYWLSLIFAADDLVSSDGLRFYGATIEYTMP